MKKIRAMAVSKTRRFEKNEQISTVGGGMYFAADPVSSMRFSGGGADVERVGMVARMDLPPGLRVVRILRSDFLEGPQVKDFALPLGNACPPLKYINLSKPQPEVRDTYQRALKDLNVAAIAYPYYAERYDSPSSNKGVPSRRMGPDRWLAFNVIDSALVEKVSLSAYTAAQIIDPNSSLNEALFYRYFQDFRLKKKVEVSETFRAWADRNLITQRGYDAFFEKTP